MIPQEITFYRPETLDEALQAWREASRPRYFAGGTEIVTLAREGKEQSTDLVDLKALPGLREMSRGKGNAVETEELSFGAALTLNAVVDGGLFTLLGHCCGGVADRTARNSITLGGNICGMLPYREAVLPFLLLDGEIEIAGPAEPEVSAGRAGHTGHTAPAAVRRVPVRSLFNKRLNLHDGEFVARFTVDASAVSGVQSAGEPGGLSARKDPTPVGAGTLYGPVEASGWGPRGGWFYHRRTRESRIDYPVSTVAMILLDGELRLAIAGTWGYPYRAVEAEAIFREAMQGGAVRSAFDTPQKLERLATETLATEMLANEMLDTKMVNAVQLAVKDDIRAGREYRREMTASAIATGLRVLTGGASTGRSV